jgi:oxygen-independent coproporphyrinogen-3 oxidase
MCHKARMSEPWGIYVHVPWCRRRCPYCDFYFEVGTPEAPFEAQIVSEYRHRRPSWPESKAATLYFGGGTPSLLDPKAVEDIVSSVDLKSGAEITLEANPEDISKNSVKALKSAGINRISLGVQSLEDGVLHALGRKHSAVQAWDAIQASLDSGIERLSVDLICGVPNEDPKQVFENIARLSQLGVGHISSYLLTVEPKTALEKRIAKGLAPKVDDEQQAQIYEDLQSVMSQNGYQQYEVSSYAKPGQESKHNRNYWGKGSYLGLGPSAHSMLFLEDGRVKRDQNKASLKEWLQSFEKDDFREVEVLSKEHSFLEAVAFGIRDVLVGVDLYKLADRHQCSIPHTLIQAFELLERKGFVRGQGKAMNLTPLGVRFCDAVAREILSC